MYRRLLVTLAVVFALASVPATATVNTSANKTIALGNGSQTQFTFTFIGVNCAYINVIYTDALGNQTTLVEGTGTTQFQCALNSVPQGGLWGAGGTITYNPNSSPIATGTTLTIYRSLPLTQAISLQNQASVSVLGKGSEMGLDTGVMQGQQISEAIGRAIQANIANSAPPLPLPPATQLANLGLCADSTGNNIIGCSLPSTGVISSAMQPVVDAASLSAGRLAFGLGSMGQENINGGSCGGASIQDDGSAGGPNGVGYARVVRAPVSDSTNQSVVCAFHLTKRIATGPISYTLPRASALFAGFEFQVYVVSGLITFAPNANDTFQGVGSGNSVIVTAGSVCTVSTNAASSGNWYLNCNNSAPALSSSAASSALTITLSGAAFLSFRDPATCSGSTCSNGDPLWAIPQGNLSVTVPSTATLGTVSSNVPFRLYVFAAYNSGTPVLGVALCSTTTGYAINGCGTAWETRRNSASAINTGSTSAGTLYTSISITNDAVRLIGYCDYSNGLTTAGTWASACSGMAVCIAPLVCHRPGDIVQSFSLNGNVLSGGGASFPSPAPGLQQSVNLTTSPNLIRISASMILHSGTSGTIEAQIYRNIGGSFASCTTAIGQPQSQTSNNALLGVSYPVLDAPGTTSQTFYGVCYGVQTSAGNIGNGMMLLDEIWAALESVPTNDNRAGVAPVRVNA